ncbi:acyl-CoA carboxylase subunit beta [Streptomyces actinomycinicus]|uniref:Acyl-CoA carboxylase subunit beta n=1 Tax=Streptomyces actinomycinicus TaxID=1695166 RepID=A0A937EGL0_9ACTN|nr:acyl-CoA carboxylase subunit beta [Streptomyces actinomycinicus]MBL1082683.1 acyl-CoA carboxylase subunit beta [Streptomyces actinomycinicus]
MKSTEDAGSAARVTLTRRTTAERIAELEQRKSRARRPGSPRAAQRQRILGRLTARERIALLLDAGSFMETDALARHRSTAFGIDAQRPYGDGVITGVGTVDGRQVCVYAQDATSFNGSVGEVFGTKVGKLLDLAMSTGCPVIGINDSSGARLQEGVLALSAYGQVARRTVEASGMIPQISLIMGMCAGGAVYTPAATDFVVMVERTSHMFVTGPDVIRAVTGESVGLEELGGADVHARRTGSAHYHADGEEEAIAFVKDLLSFLPANNATEPPAYLAPAGSGRTERDRALDRLIPDSPEAPYDMHTAIETVVDDGDLLEIQQDFARNIICGFARVEGATVGVVANQPLHLAGSLDIDASEKAARFVRFCDAFNLPLLTFVDVPGFLPGLVQEHGGIIRRGAKLGFAYIESTVPKVTVITRRAYGGGYASMGSKELGADICFAWPTAEIGVMGARGGVDMLFHRDLTAADDPAELEARLTETYEEQLISPYVAAERGCIDDVVAPAETRIAVARALASLRTKRVTALPKKHSNIPL